ncbi:hypothetical protein Pan258_14800 [Symmachiella dynata]|nr:hypothetical protein Pan258_14800 [Symmachiella dynata]
MRGPSQSRGATYGDFTTLSRDKGENGTYLGFEGVIGTVFDERQRGTGELRIVPPFQGEHALPPSQPRAAGRSLRSRALALG